MAIKLLSSHNIHKTDPCEPNDAKGIPLVAPVTGRFCGNRIYVRWHIPVGYTGMALLALVPSLWFSIMNSKSLAARNRVGT